MKKYFFYTFLVLHAWCAVAQSDWVQYNTNVQLSLGGNVFSGDVCSECANMGSSVALSSRFRIAGKGFFRPEIQYNWFRAAQDINALSFSNHTFGANLAFEYGLHKLSPASFTGRAKTELFVVGQLGVLHHNPTAEIRGERTRLAPLQTEGEDYSRLVPSIGTGLSFNHEVMRGTRIGVQFDVNYLFSDYVDDVSGTYILNTNFDEIRKEAIDPSQKAMVGSQRGLKKGNDLFYRLMFSYSIKTKSKVKIETIDAGN